MVGLIYIQEPPKIVAAGENLQLDLDSGGDLFRFILTRHAGMTVERLIGEALRDLRKQPDAIIPLCELCVRHTLSKPAKEAR
jgi:hypothetical protein